MIAEPAAAALSRWSWASAGNFYSDLLGWQSVEGDGTTLLMSDGAVAAVIPNDGYWHGWRMAIRVPDLNGALDAAREAGGAVTPESFGDGAVVIDPAGVTLALVSTAPQDGPSVRSGCWDWAQLNVPDPSKVKPFYKKVLGWETGPSANDGFTYEQFVAGEHAVGGLMTIDDRSGPLVPLVWQLYFRVDDVDAAAERVTELGGRLFVEPTTIAPGRFAVCTDPGGALFGIEKMD